MTMLLSNKIKRIEIGFDASRKAFSEITDAILLVNTVASEWNIICRNILSLIEGIRLTKEVSVDVIEAFRVDTVRLLDDFDKARQKFLKVRRNNFIYTSMNVNNEIKMFIKDLMAYNFHKDSYFDMME